MSSHPAGPRVAVVTGADSGIGRATAVHLARQGLDVGITWHSDREGAEGTAEEVRAHGRRAALARMDLTLLPEAADAVDALADELGRIDVLVNNAGTGTAAPYLDLDLETVRRVLDVDLVGPFLCGQRAARRMIRQGDGGRIVNVTSVHEHQPRVGAAPYCAAKGGLGLLTQVMALELAEHGITVNAVAPGEIATPMTGQEDVDVHRVRRPGVPAGRPGDAREVAAVIAFLCGSEASYVTGASWSVDGGMLRMGPQAGSHLEDDSWRRV
ncbi:SDR family oxidoreductase [Streptomyces mobaraensis NBRC 13819 = DSM 40847]|uniref:Oxidoreductase n=1 Tax=Streptomyces mobaraensis (strain ATCC 29032 / DSM 40847 / JCM 4168 / NBRC 13819 / NCIMB 11159 / IPCR 16-22) TaxID=1223523 RepID=M3C7G2_STRM1|nr:SDR family oxidoreductase [Streptomyces mobaraensis]EME99871.1 oxidoreductase [Streptomyces mobaraensis NBRC 13819 = DSM 40847]QTT72229.1 SDR family oxidoreductase [Streptomyces mobaraensis NBRC 13819 = DSM 40847]